MLPPVRHRKPSERGFALLLVFLMSAAIALMLYQQMPRVAFESERDKEQLLIDRGEQYKRAIQVFFVAYKRYPSTIEELEHTNDKRYLRKRYKDPYTGKDEWRLVHVNAAGLLTDSLVKPLPNPNDPNNQNKNQLASNNGPLGTGGAAGGTSGVGTSGLGTAGIGGVPGIGGIAGMGGSAPGGFSPITTTFPGTAGAPGTPGAANGTASNNGVPGAPPELNSAVYRRPSDRPLAPGQFPVSAPAPVSDPNNPNPGGNPQYPNNPAGQNQPGFPQAGFQPNGVSSGNFAPLSSTDFPPISLQAMQQQQGGQGQNNGQFPAGQQFPGQAVPGQPAGNQVRLGQNGQFIPVQPNGAQNFPGSQQATPIAQPFPGSQPFPGAQPQQYSGNAQQFPQPFPGGQPFPQQGQGGQQFPQGAPLPQQGQSGAVDPNAAAGAGGNQALNLINQLLTTPRQPPAGVATGTNPTTGGGLGIAGVASTHDGVGLKIYKEKKKYKEWEFVFDPNANAPKAPAPTNPLGNNNGQNPQGGASGTPGIRPGGTSSSGTNQTANPSGAGSFGTQVPPACPPSVPELSMQANALAAGSPAALARRLTLYRCALWIALAAYPWIIRLLAASVAGGAAAVFGALAIALIPPGMAWLVLNEANRPGRNPRAWPGLAQEALLGAICAPLFVILSVLLRAALGGGRDLVWYALLAAVAATRWLPAPSEEAGPAWRWRRVHYGAAAIVTVFGLAHVANHVTAIYSLDAHVAVQNALRLVYRQPVVQAVLLIGIGLQMSTGARLIWAARSYRFTALRNLQILSGANLVAFFVSHLSATLILGPRILKADTTFAWATGGAHGMLGSPASTQLLPYYFLGVASFFLHLGAAARWSLIPALGPAGARRTAYALMIGGAIVALALVFPMLGTRLLS